MCVRVKGGLLGLLEGAFTNGQKQAYLKKKKCNEYIK